MIGSSQMSPDLLILLVLSPTAAVVVALCFIMWSARSPATAPTVLLSGAVLALWVITAAVLATRGVFLQPDGQALPPVGIALLIIFAVLGAALSGSRHACRRRRALARRFGSIYSAWQTWLWPSALQ